LPKRCPTVDYSVAIRCSGNMFREPLSSNGHIRHNIKMDLKELTWEGVDWINVIED
jgi:hypothetical protein